MRERERLREREREGERDTASERERERCLKTEVHSANAVVSILTTPTTSIPLSHSILFSISLQYMSSLCNNSHEFIFESF